MDGWTIAEHAITLLLGGVGGGVVLFVNWWVKERELDRADQRDQRARDLERQKEQKALAIELLELLERFAGTAQKAAQARTPPKEIAETLELLREEIASRAVGLHSPQARALFGRIDTALWFMTDPDDFNRQHASPWALKQGARSVLGAVQRGEPLPQPLDAAFEKLIARAEEYDAYVEDQIRAQEEYAAEHAENERRKAEETRRKAEETRRKAEAEAAQKAIEARELTALTRLAETGDPSAPDDESDNDLEHAAAEQRAKS